MRTRQAEHQLRRRPKTRRSWNAEIGCRPAVPNSVPRPPDAARTAAVERPVRQPGGSTAGPTVRLRQPSTSKPSPVSDTNMSSRLGPRPRRSPAPDPPASTRAATTFSGAAPASRPVRSPGRRPPPRRPRAPRGRARPAPGWSVSTRASRRPRRRAARRRALRDQPAGAHDADVGAHLLDLGQQVGGDEHRGAVGGERLIRDRTSRVPCGSSPLVGSSRTSRSAGAEQGGGDGQPLLHAQRVGAVPLAGGGRQADPVQRRVDAAPGGSARGGPGRRRRGGAGCRAPDRYG